jgi:hypothetical protein
MVINFSFVFGITKLSKLLSKTYNLEMQFHIIHDTVAVVYQEMDTERR